MLASGVATFVVGFGGGVDPNQLNVFADAGGVPRNDPTTRYYQADDAMGLQMALDQIAGSVVGCSFSLAETPPNVDDLFVFLDDQSVPRDTSHTNGWDYDPATNQITFYGSACDELQAGTVTDRRRRFRLRRADAELKLTPASPRSRRGAARGGPSG